MKSRLIFALKYFVFWIIIFLVQKILFMLFNYRQSFELNFAEWAMILYKGLPLDLSAAAYISIVPAVIIFAEFITGMKLNRLFINFYTYIILFFVLYLGVVDMDLYSYWGYKLDITPLLYIKTPGEALASVKISEIIMMVLIFIFLYIFFLKFYIRSFKPSAMDGYAVWWKSMVTGLLMVFILILPARGGIGIVPMNLSRVYFHKNEFANHSAINVLWNTIYSFTERSKLSAKADFMEAEKAASLFEDLMNHGAADESPIMIKPNSNILLIILESFTNKVIEGFGGEAGVTPGLNSLCRSSLLFKNFYASGNRSDKGMLALFSGFPAQPITSIINYPSKIQKLPFLFDPFHDKGYSTAFYYGGNIDFSNFRAFFTRPSLHKLVSIDDFSEEIPLQKWGIPDEYLFEKLFDDLSAQTSPFFYSCFTLSSHDPFDIPMEPVFGNESRDDLSRSSFYYADKCLFDFILKAMNSHWWDNTLVVIVADHGSRSPGNAPHYFEDDYRIPMIWTGGALLRDSVITKLGAQTDLAATLLSQYGMDHSGFKYSKDLLNPHTASFSFYSFNNGFGFRTDSSAIIIDNDFDVLLKTEGNYPEREKEKGMSILQTVMTDFVSK